MDEENKITIFHLYRKNGSSLFLHPFNSSEKLIEILEKYNVEGKYGREPRVESLTLFRNELYRMIEESVKRWVAEIRFIPKFLISSATFLISYLLLSLTVRDPMPMLDEIAISLGAAVFIYIYIGKRDKRSNISVKKRMELRNKVDSIVFFDSNFVKKVEELLHLNESESREKVLEYMLSPPDASISKEEEKDALQLLGYLKKQFNKREFRRQEKIFSRLYKKKVGNNNTKLFTLWPDPKKIDLSLFALYTRMKKNLEKVR
ncbi:MAG: hypothetical protein DRP87_00945 [Spirochaetes bacterium]|nr:MAG: hypothetical protein DRP87_00945 [Spirochaetota bacterium]